MSAAAGAVPQPSAPAPLVGLTHLRALAITLVFVYHYRLFEHPAWVERVGAFGWTGDAENIASQRVARRLSLRPLGWSWRLGSARNHEDARVHPLSILRRRR